MLGLILIALGMALLAAVQTGVGSVWRPLGVKPDLVLIGVVLVGLIGGPRRALGAALIGGLTLDLLSILPIGLNVLALALVAPLTALRVRADPSSIVLPLLLTPIATLLYNGILAGEALLIGRLLSGDWWIRQILFPLIFVNTLLVPVVWLPISLVWRDRPRFGLKRS